MDIMTPTTQAMLAGIGSWLAITLGAACIFLRKEFSPKLLQLMLGLAGGMMLGATFFALLIPSMELAQEHPVWPFASGAWAFIPPVLGLLLGALFLRTFDALLPHTHSQSDTTEGISTSWHRSILLVTAMALHHIPEGLALGVSYGAFTTDLGPIATESGAQVATSTALSLQDILLLTASMILQGIPEGTVVSMALLREGLSRNMAFLCGMLSGCTTPIGTVLGLWATGLASQFLPVALAFAAGAMLYIIVEDIIPESQASGHGNAATIAVIGGLIVVMIFQTLFA